MSAPPAWVTAMVDQRMALLTAVLGGRAPADYPPIFMPLTEPAEGASPADFDRWERTCDHCGTYCGDGVDFYIGQITRDLEGTQVSITFGACSNCVEVPA